MKGHFLYGSLVRNVSLLMNNIEDRETGRQCLNYPHVVWNYLVEILPVDNLFGESITEKYGRRQGGDGSLKRRFEVHGEMACRYNLGACVRTSVAIRHHFHQPLEDW